MTQRRLRAATAAVYRALATVPGADARRALTSGVELPQADPSTVRTGWRGRIDALAMRARFSDPMTYARFEPRSGPARTLFSLLEQNRVEALGARAFAGIRCNLAALAEERWMRARPEAIIRGPGAAWIETFALLARLPLGAPLSDSALEAIGMNNGRWMSVAEQSAVAQLAQRVDDQVDYAIQALRLIDTVLQSVPSAPPIPPESDAPSDRIETDAAPAPAALDAQHADVGSETASAATHPPQDAAGDPQSYRVYTRAFDAEVTADALVDQATLVQLRAELDRHIGHRLSEANRWAHRLRRKLMSLQSRGWEFDCDEGELDASRLTRIATRPLESLVFRREKDSEFPATIVTLLVDNSGSMRGRPIATAAACAELLGRMLEKCGVKTEILGFTTRNYRGGLAHRQWAASGRVAHPGRLTDLRHIIYKSSEESWRRASGRMGAMLEGEILRENVDGEALLWAHTRLMRHREPRKIMIVISDGAPLDEVTLQANDFGYLDRHLKDVVTRIERSPVKLVAIGIGHDVTRYYRRAVVLDTVDDLGETLVTELFDLFDPSRPLEVAA